MSIRHIVPIEQTEWSLAPLPAWVHPRTIDWSWRPPEGHGIACLLIDEQYEVASQASSLRSVRLLQSVAAVQALGQVEIEFDPAAQRLLVHDVVIWRQDPAGTWQRGAPVPREAFLLRQREQQLEQQMLNGRVSLVALLEDVRVGDALELAWTLEPRDRLPGLRFTAFHAFAWTVPVASASVTLHLSRDHPVHWQLQTPDGITPPVEDVTAEWVRWRFDAPPLFVSETNVPGSHWAYPLLEITAWHSWAEVADFFRALWSDALNADAATIAAEAARLGSSRVTAAAIIAAIRFVQQDVRYLAVDFGHGAGMLPNAASTVLKRRFGDCKDKSVLLTALLRALGVNAHPVLVGSGWREAVARLQPSTGCFNHAIVAFDFEGRRHYVDPTLLGQGGDLEHLVAPPFRVGLELAEGSRALTAVPNLPPAELTLTETFTLDRRGREGAIDQVLEANAWLADDIRAALLRQGPAQFHKSGADVLQQHFPALESGADTARVEDDVERNEIRVIARHALPTWGVKDQKPPNFFVYGAHGLFIVVERVDDRELERRQPWALRHPMRVRHRVVVRGRPVHKVKPDTFRAEGPGFSYTCEVRARRREVTFDYCWQSTADEIAPARWSEFCRERAKALARAGATVGTAGLTFGGALRYWAIAFGVIAGLVQIVVKETREKQAVNDAVAVERAAGAAWDALKRGDFSGAYATGLPLRAHFAHNFEMQMMFAESALRTGHFAEATAALEIARKLKPSDPIVDLLTANLHETRGEFAQARALLLTLARDPAAADRVHFDLARVTERIGDTRAARAAWETVLARQPAQPEALFSLARLIWSGGEHAHADAVITGAIAAQPAASPALESTLARYYLATGRAAEALGPARRATALAPQDPQLAYQLTMALLAAGDRVAALDEARSMTTRFSESPLAWGALATSAATANDAEQAEPAFRNWLRLAPTDSSAHSNYGFFLHREGRDAAARDVLEKATRSFPADGNLWLNLAVVLEALGEEAAAREARRQADALLTDEQRATLVN